MVKVNRMKIKNIIILSLLLCAACSNEDINLKIEKVEVNLSQQVEKQEQQKEQPKNSVDDESVSNNSQPNQSSESTDNGIDSVVKKALAWLANKDDSSSENENQRVADVAKDSEPVEIKDLEIEINSKKLSENHKGKKVSKTFESETKIDEDAIKTGSDRDKPEIDAEAIGKPPKSNTISLAGARSIKSDLSGFGFVVDLSGDYLFEFDKSTLTSDAESALKGVMELYNDFSGREIKVSGHTDSEGSDDYNLDLSKRRALTVKEWLESAGVSSKSIKTQGFGETRPVAKNSIDGVDNPKGQALNRRVDISIKTDKKVNSLPTLSDTARTTNSSSSSSNSKPTPSATSMTTGVDTAKSSVAQYTIAEQPQLVTTQSEQSTETIQQMKALHPQKKMPLSLKQSRQQSLKQPAITQAKNKRLDLEKHSLEPEIVIEWPELRRQGDMYVAQAPAGSLLNIVGTAYSPTVIKNFSINGKSEELDRNGLFKKTIEVGVKPVPINLSVLNENDKQSQIQFVIEPTLQTTSAAPVESAAIDNKVTNIKDLDFGRYYALVIGNNDYKDLRIESLDTAVNDAKAVANLLETKYGFEVDLLTDINRDTLLKALESMRKKLTEKDNLLIYYAGHGVVDPENDQGYWIPVDGSSTSTSRWISNATITDQIRAMSARNILVVADSCYSGSLMRSSALAIRSGLSPEKKALRFKSDILATTRVVLSSGGMQPVVDSIGGSPHSVFTGAMLKTLRENSQLLDADSLATSVSHTVALATKDSVKQFPRYAPLPRAGHEGGEFYFVPKEW